MGDLPQTVLLQGHSLGYRSRGRNLVTDVSITVSQKEIVTIIGPNGAGKSTLLALLLGLLKPGNGKVSRRPGLRVGYMPQKLQLNPQLPLTVERFLRLTPEVRLEPREALARTGVADLINSDMQHLSGGEFQRVLLARGLLREPELLVLDEPVQGVDVNGQNQLYRLINQLRDEFGCGVLMVSHDLHTVMASTDHVVCINGHVCCHGHPDKVSRDPAYLALFGDADSQVAHYTHHHDHSHDTHGDVVEAEAVKHSCEHH